MCLAVPGKVLSVHERDGTLMSEVDFGGVHKDVCLQYIPDVAIGDYVVVHVGFAIQRLDEDSALRTLAEFEHLGVLKEEFGDGFAIAAKQAGVDNPDAPQPGASNSDASAAGATVDDQEAKS
ncbi:HypC/HybG/HupF family hydrogenase formation chaperone [Nocardia sp. CA-107356]|uniref:HypC/HybG/HupF family hydrogenase formation chaperone n=1 Tax=Nocardia sp. CA-107356 TaxID=3239972 RepID=UPI003D8F7A69